jgi:hypothetical protein
VVTDGLRAGSVAAYFRTLFARRGFDHWTASLDFVPVANDTNLRTLEQDGAREIQLHSTLTAARGAWIADANDRGLAAIGRRVRGAVRAMIEEETPLLRPDKVEVAVSVKVKGGIKRNPNLRDALLAASKELVQDPDSDLPFAIVTGKGDTLTSSDIRIGRTVALERLEAQDCLDRHAVYAELSGFYAHLVERDLMAP